MRRRSLREVWSPALVGGAKNFVKVEYEVLRLGACWAKHVVAPEVEVDFRDGNLEVLLETRVAQRQRQTEMVDGEEEGIGGVGVGLDVDAVEAIGDVGVDCEAGVAPARPDRSLRVGGHLLRGGAHFEDALHAGNAVEAPSGKPAHGRNPPGSFFVVHHPRCSFVLTLATGVELHLKQGAQQAEPAKEFDSAIGNASGRVALYVHFEHEARWRPRVAEVGDVDAAVGILSSVVVVRAVEAATRDQLRPHTGDVVPFVDVVTALSPEFDNGVPVSAARHLHQRRGPRSRRRVALEVDLAVSERLLLKSRLQRVVQPRGDHRRRVLALGVRRIGHS
mmetsp:Transcript_28838/g.88219  ORF Transcript_28838/g.88219 Transcript_28838/m.88219 type:complete len:334 (-) Transcript_28838:387-1388(-)